MGLGACLIAVVLSAVGGGPEEQRRCSASVSPARGHATGWVENKGQWPSDVLYVGRAKGALVRVEPRAIVLQIQEPRGDSIEGEVMRLRFEREPRRIVPGDPLPGRRHYFVGANPSNWTRDVRSYDAVTLEDVYPGVDLRLRMEASALAMDWLLDPGVEPVPLSLDVEGPREIRTDSNEDLVLFGDLASVRLHRPDESDIRESSLRRFLVEEVAEARFELGLELVPTSNDGCSLATGLEWATYLGGPLGTFGSEVAGPVAKGPDGSVTIAGGNAMDGFPATPGSFQHPGTIANGFVTRFDAVGGELIFSTILGGTSSNGDNGVFAMAVDDLGRTYGGGRTSSRDYPTTPGAMANSFPELSNTYLFRLSADGSDLEYSTFLGGPQGPVLVSLAVASSGAVVFGGPGAHSNFPATPGAYDTTNNGGGDAFVARLNPDGSALEWATLLGGLVNDHLTDLALDSLERVVVVGTTASKNFPTTPGVFGPGAGGSPLSPLRGFVSRLSADGKQLELSSYLGFPGVADPRVCVDAWDRPIVAGATAFFTLPVTSNALDPTKDLTTAEGFAIYFDEGITSAIYATYFGEVGTNDVRDLHVDPSGVVTLAGTTLGAVATTPGSWQATEPGQGDFYVARLSPAGDRLLHSTFLGTGQADELFGLTVLPTGEAIVVGKTSSTLFPVTPGAYDTTYNGGPTDIALAQLSMLPEGIARFGSSTPSCRGLLSMGAVNAPVAGTDDFSVYTSAAPPERPGFLVVGLAPLSIPNSLGDASLWVDMGQPHVITTTTSDAQGFAEVPVRLPPALLDHVLHAQFVFFNDVDCHAGSRLSSSNALAICVLADVP